ncbi:MAG: methyltransferase [Fibrobacteria bacterium]|jgi:site-specific DNA-methyltransferase (adenine-specific)/adenine-specific DNA-methyltransferase|nr:methyltransferase [Fibrobacteria bacterium]
MPTLNWIGKEAVVNHHHQVPFHLLKDVPTLACGSPGDGNLIVQGDNLVALKALLPYYAGQVKCIYIDPPYNTGNENWIYNDNVNSPVIRDWLGKVVGKEGETLDRHDRWLCMMYPRISLLQQFLRNDGVIFVSIDEFELGNLLVLFDDIFGPLNRIGIFTWQRKKKGSHLDAHLRKMTEYVLCYARKKSQLNGLFGEDAYADKLQPLVKRTNKGKRLSFPAKLVSTGLGDGVYESGFRGKQGTGLNFLTSFTVSEGIVTTPLEVSGCFVWTQKKLDEEISLGTTIDLSRKFGFNVGRHDQSEKSKTPTTILTPAIGIGTNEDASEQLSSIFKQEMGKVFPYSKPDSLIQYLIRAATDDEPTALVLDSFAGSGTTGHAVLNLNAQDGGSRRFILVEMEPTIAREITSERVRRVAKGYTNAKGEEVEGLGGGFRYCELGDSLFDESGKIRDTVRFADLARHVWFTETGEPLPRERVPNSPLLGTFRGVAIYLLYNGILGDKSTSGGNVLTRAVLANIPGYSGQKIIYCAGCLLGSDRLQSERIVIRQTPYEIRVS